MNTKKRNLGGHISYLVIGLLVVVLAACTTMQAKVAWTGESAPGKMTYSYEKFTGIERENIAGEEGKTLILSYDIAVNDGRVFIQVMDPQNQVLWSIIVKSDTADTVELPLNFTGEYPLIVRGENTSGSFDISWVVQ